MHYVSFALLALPFAIGLSIGKRFDKLIDCLERSLSPHESIVLPGDLGFSNDTVRFSTLNAPTFRAVSRVSNEHDIRVSINCARLTATHFLVTGTGHGTYSGFGELQNGLEIYIGNLDGIKVDPKANVMTIGSATLFKDVISSLYNVGKNVPTGSSPCVGMVGATLGAGIGRLQGLYGLILDSLLSVRIMLPNTTVVEVSHHSNPELFWGIRGAGFNFGVILSATYRIYDEVPNGLHFSADYEFPISSAKPFYQALKDEAANMPAPLCITTSLTWNSSHNAPTLKVNAAYAGPESEGRVAVQFLDNIGPTLRRNYTTVPWDQLLSYTLFSGGDESVLECRVSSGKREVLSAAFNEVDVDAHVSMTEQFNDMVTRYPQMRASDNGLYFCATQVVRRYPKKSTAYPWRQAIGHYTWGIVYDDDSSTDATIDNLPKRMRATISRTAGTDGLNTYVGFSNGDEPLRALFSQENLSRLAALKKVYDPRGLFNAYHPLPTFYP
ncbi:hypothetical protein GGS23DRAFT_601730 [Durotheca rogersii]|uniref:uncharacterized protein n=1 Tax=Durotheca rogersii TaxID=419775 RepID=UPI00221E8385|nr:uncharacterized protein GGS23DRAFT_601730 [Durotheca rogersii]KAI5853645.1 hypothetical protein GGS23DRAFT_601730 [Durotheca rogersii]